MSRLSVEVIGNHATERTSVLDAVASLPRSFRLGSPGDVAAICAGPDWLPAAHHAVTDGARAVVVMEPTPVPVEAIAPIVAAADSAGTRVVLARGWASNPAVTVLRDHQLDVGPTTLVDSHAEVGPDTSADHALHAQLDLVGCLFGAEVELTDLVRTASGHLASGRLRRADRAPVQLFGSRSVAGDGSIRVRELLARGRRALTLPDGRTAQPGQAWLGDTAGHQLLPTIHESSTRRVFGLLRAAIDAGVTGSEDLSAFAEIQRTVAGSRAH